MFPVGSFQRENESNGDYKPNGLLQFRNDTDKTNTMHNCVINDSLQIIQDCIDRKGKFANHEFCTISGCSYVGRNKTNKNARFCHALIFDIDDVDAPQLENLFVMVEEGMLPNPTAICVSGNGIHLTYILDKPVPLYRNKAEMLNNLKAVLSRLLWNAWTSQDPNIQYQGIVQGYRVCGTKTKKGHIAKAYLCGKTVTLDYLIDFVDDFDSIAMLKPTKLTKNGKTPGYLSERLKKLKKDRKLSWHLLEELCEDELRYSLDEARTKWPEWYQRRIVDKQKPGHWHFNRGMYDWWLNIIKAEAHPGIRKKCLRVLGAYAQKCDIPEDEFIKDAYSLIEAFDALTIDDSNHFTAEDIADVVRMYREQDMTKMSVAGIQRMTGIEMHRKKERRRDEHLEKCRQIRDSHYDNKKTHWYDTGGRPSKEAITREYIEKHPEETSVTEIARECGVSRPTIYKYLKNS